VFHQKFGNGNVTAVDGNKLTIAFDKAGEKRGGGGMDEADNTMAARAVKAGAEPISPERPPSSQIGCVQAWLFPRPASDRESPPVGKRFDARSLGTARRTLAADVACPPREFRRHTPDS
jgi:hypothetical protein